MGVRRVAKGVGDFLVDTAGEAVADAVLSALACALLGGLALIAYLSWSFSPRLTIAGAGLISLFLAHGAWKTFRTSASGLRRGLAVLTTAGFALAASTAVFLLLYTPGCGCL
ncbi:lysine transporter LysE [Streptomyces sp. NBC_00102]|uniref:lysine transporter LysE n=1 Tax=Streptomyces sp. NBC_00102 TaxID=2975652 RepID=UPI00225337E3|nr:lysine transporter LysE [Streptomyces sp. NBC_00102]MCX5396447.1 lysine transporter LysE [Streptomyces sp. NBC_00102]